MKNPGKRRRHRAWSRPSAPLHHQPAETNRPPRSSADGDQSGGRVGMTVKRLPASVRRRPIAIMLCSTRSAARAYPVPVQEEDRGVSATASTRHAVP